MAANARIQNINTNISITLLSILMSNMSNCRPYVFRYSESNKKTFKAGPVVLGRHLKKWPPTAILKTLISPEPLCLF